MKSVKLLLLSLIIISFSAEGSTEPHYWDVHYRGRVGPLKIGDTKKRVEQVLGAPEISRGGFEIYTSLGVSVAFSINETVNGFLLSSRFEGCNLGDSVPLMKLSRDQMLAEFGKPSKILQNKDSETIDYEEIGMSFMFFQGKILQVVIK